MKVHITYQMLNELKVFTYSTLLAVSIYATVFVITNLYTNDVVTAFNVIASLYVGNVLTVIALIIVQSKTTDYMDFLFSIVFGWLILGMVTGIVCKDIEV